MREGLDRAHLGENGMNVSLELYVFKFFLTVSLIKWHHRSQVGLLGLCTRLSSVSPAFSAFHR